jgi:LPPG:FO 2-phospho-L-lactate transferase
VDPILNVIPLNEWRGTKPVVAVSPIIGGKAVKGPAAKMFDELGIEPSAAAVASHYRTILAGFVLDKADLNMEDQIKKLNIETRVVNTLMNHLTDRTRLADDVLDFIGSL